MLTDYHSHFLPAMDDGPKSIQESMQMLDMWSAQGVERVIATPHFYSHMESAEAFLSRREKSLTSLSEKCEKLCVVTGAEVYIEKGLSSLALLQRLTMGESKYILLEMPYGSFKEWILTEIYQTAYNWGLIPVIAHIDRYTQWYSRGEISRVLSIQDAVLQINNDALFKRAALKFALELIRSEFPIIFGSDSHNVGDRPPNVEAANKVLWRKLNKSELLALSELNESFL